MQLRGHEHLVRHLELAAQPEIAAATKPEAWVVFRMADHNDRRVAYDTACLEAMPHELGTDAAAGSQPWDRAR